MKTLRQAQKYFDWVLDIKEKITETMTSAAILAVLHDLMVEL